MERRTQAAAHAARIFGKPHDTVWPGRMGA
jgi:hypothetical protein